MKNAWNHIIEQGRCPSEEQLRLYSEGTLTKEQRFHVENHLAECEMCSDLLEGIMQTTTQSVDVVEKEIQQKVHEMLSKEKSKTIVLPMWQKMSIAASILLLIGISIFFVTHRTEEQLIAKNDLPVEQKTPTSAPQNEASQPVVQEHEMRFESAKKEKTVRLQDANSQGAKAYYQMDAEMSVESPVVSKAEENAKEMKMADEAPAAISIDKKDEERSVVRSEKMEEQQSTLASGAASNTEHKAMKKSTAYSMSPRKQSAAPAETQDMVTVDTIETSINTYKTILAQNSTDKNALFGLTRCYILQKNADKATETIQTLLKSSSDQAVNTQLEEVQKLVKAMKFEKALKKMEGVR